MIKPGKKCIAKSCDKCNFFDPWHLSDDMGREKTEFKCSFKVLFEEIPRIRGSIDGCQGAVNQTFNKVDAFGEAAIETLKKIDTNLPKLLR